MLSENTITSSHDPEGAKWHHFKAWFHRVVIWRYYGLHYGLLNIRRFWSAAWNFDTCDWTGAAELMEIAFREIAEHHRKSKTVRDWAVTARQAATASALCRRLISGHLFYSRMHGYDRYSQMSEQQRTAMFTRAHYSRMADKRHLGFLIGRYLDYWWD